ncbi:amidohydrolase family protein [Candidatus Peregrinibacteria bacterium]|nr:amidohydrolase family protein [Candidatus Peregrinibacteria bacterium]
MAKILLKNGEIASSGGVFRKDILIEEDKISNILDKGEKVGDAEEIECKGKVILPGVIDAHVHFREPGATHKEDFESGSKAAVSGGVTTVCDMPNTNPSTITLGNLKSKRELIKGKSYANYLFYIGYNGKNIDEINKTSNISGVKVYCADSTGNLGISSMELENAFSDIDRDKLLVFHAEDGECVSRHKEEYFVEFRGRENDLPASIHSKIRPPECAVKMVKRLCDLAKIHNRPIHICHVSTSEELEIIAEHRKFGVTCEIAPHHLTLSEDDYDRFDNFIKVNPPVRDRFEIFGLWKNIKAGVVDNIATDHAPHLKEEKEKPYLEAPAGIPGVEMMLPILLNTVINEGMTFEELAILCCERPAEIFRMKNKGFIKKGYDADLVIIDKEIEKELKNEDVVSKCGWSPYSGSIFKGWPIMTFVNGELVYEKGKIIGKPNGREVVTT